MWVLPSILCFAASPSYSPLTPPLFPHASAAPLSPSLTYLSIPIPILIHFPPSSSLSQLREKMKEITELRYDSDRKDEEIERLRKEDSSLGGSLEIERRSRQKQLAELHARDGELMLMRCVAVVDIFVIAYNHDN
jgi:hypothetical protein